MFYLAYTGTVQRPVLWLYHTLVWNLLFCRLDIASLHDCRNWRDSQQCVAGVNLKVCFKLHRETSTVIGCL